MTTITNQKKRKWLEKIEKINQFFDRVFQNKKHTFLMLGGLLFTILFVIQVLIILVNNSFYNNFSDDVIQYYTIMNDFIMQVKAGTISWFNLNNYLGASIFSDVYYIPFDIFTFITFIFSYIVPTEIAYSIVELVKILTGVLLLAYYLSLKGMKNRTIFWMGLVYFISGGTASFMAFPVFLSLTVYLPISLLVIHAFFHKKRWIVPLYAFAIIFYDFYLGYTLLAFISIVFIIELFKQPNLSLGKFILNGIVFLGLLLLGVLMSAVILYPSILYILEDTYRPIGTFTPVEWDLGFITIQLFKPEIYIRFIAKIFTAQKAIGFYGFTNDYKTEHASMFISVIGFAYMNYIFFMRSKENRVYKTAIFFGILFMVFPLFSRVFSGTPEFPYTRWINMYPIIQILILANVFDKFGFEDVRPKKMTMILIPLMLVNASMIFYYIVKLSSDTRYSSRDVLTADTVLMGVAFLLLAIMMVFLWIKKAHWIKYLFVIEFLIAIGYIYSGPFSIRNKIDEFQEANKINEYLNSVLDEEEFYRVYVDLDRFDVEKFNFNRMTSFPTNTQIFHSWTDSETNKIGYLLFNSWEYQSKEKLEIHSIYLSQFLGYKYVLVGNDKPYYFDSDYFTLKYANLDYMLYEINQHEPFQVYESYTTENAFKRKNYLQPDVQKILLATAIIDSERYEDILLNLENYELPAKQTISYQTVTSYQTTNEAMKVEMISPTDNVLKDYYRYSNEAFNLIFDSGAIYIKISGFDVSSYGEVFMEYLDGETKSCEITSTESHQVKCEFWSNPRAIYFEKTEGFATEKTLVYRMERAIDGSAYLVYDMSKAFMNTRGMLYFQLRNQNSSLNKAYLEFDRVFMLDRDGAEYESFSNYYYYGNQINLIYILKTSDMYQQLNLFSLPLEYSMDNLLFYENNTTNDLVQNQTLEFKGSTIHLTYERVSSSSYDQLVVVPITYSEEWEFVGDIQYETLSVSGGFLGIIIPNDVTEVDLTMKFIPKGIKMGALGTVVGVGIYLTIFGVPYFIKKNRRGKETISLEMNSNEENNDNHSII